MATSLAILAISSLSVWFLLNQSDFFESKKPVTPEVSPPPPSPQPTVVVETEPAEVKPPPKVRFVKPDEDEPEPPPPPRRNPFTYSYYVENPLLAPAEVTLNTQLALPLRRGTEMVGEITIPSGTVVRVQEVRSDYRLLVQSSGRTFLVNLGETDFVERAKAQDAPDAPWNEGEPFASVEERFQFQDSQLSADEQQFIQDYEKWAMKNNWIMNIQVRDQVIRATADPRAFSTDNPEALRRMAALLAKAYVLQSKEAGIPHYYAECILVHPSSGQILERMSFHEP